MMLASMKLSGRSLIGFREGTGTGEPLYATDPTTGQHLQPGFIPATGEEVDLAARLAAEAFELYRHTPGRDRSAFLRKIAAKIEAIAEEVIERAGQETALPRPRLQGETARTCGQLRLFAQVAEEGSWVNAHIDHADPNRKPIPKPDIRSVLRPLGPVVVSQLRCCPRRVQKPYHRRLPRRPAENCWHQTFVPSFSMRSELLLLEHATLQPLVVLKQILSRIGILHDS
jgi:hypothetical protein